MHAKISDPYMHNKSIGCTGIILKDPGEDSGGKGKSKRAKKKMARRITFLCAIFTACLDFPYPHYLSLSLRGYTKIWFKLEF